jgi:hypothetical protein
MKERLVRYLPNERAHVYIKYWWVCLTYSYSASLARCALSYRPTLRAQHTRSSTRTHYIRRVFTVQTITPPSSYLVPKHVKVIHVLVTTPPL